MSFKKVLKNTSYILISQQISMVIRFFAVIILVRYLGKDSFGIWSVVQAVPCMFLVLSYMGITAVMERKIARDKSVMRDTLAQVLSIKLFLSIVFLSVVYIFCIFFRYETDVKRFIFIASIAYVFINYTQVLAAVFRATENFVFESVTQILRSLTLFLVVCMVIIFDLKLDGLMHGFLIGWVLLTICCYTWYINKYGLSIKLFNLGSYITIVKSALPFALMEFVNPIFMQINTILLSRMSTYESVTIYSAPFKIMIFLSALSFSFKRALFPTLSKLSTMDRENYSKTFHYACKITALVGIPVAIGTLLLSREIIYLFFSKAFTQSVIVLRIMAITLILHYFRQVFNITLYASNMEWHASIIFMLATLLNIILSIILIPKWNYMGPCIATLLSEALILALGFYLISSRLIKTIHYKSGVRLTLAIMTVGVILVLSAKLPLLLQISIGALGYGVSIFLFKVISLEEYRNLSKSFRLQKNKYLFR